MKYAEIPYVNKPVSRIIFGTAMDPFMKGQGGKDLLDEMFALGVNTFDLARKYMGAETSIGTWIEERNIRDKVVLLSKCGHPSVFGRKRINKKDIHKDLEKSLRELKTDYIDIYLLHRDDPGVEVGEIVEIFNGLQSKGKIGAFGGSNWTHGRIAQANEYAYKNNLIPFTVSSPNFGLADQVADPWGGGCISISGPSGEQAREWYQNKQIPLIAYSSLGRGMFTGKVKSGEREKVGKILDKAAIKGYVSEENFQRLRRCEELALQKNSTVPQIAMAWIYNQNLNTFAVVSTSSSERMKENIEALSLELTKNEIMYLDLKRNKFCKG